MIEGERYAPQCAVVPTYMASPWPIYGYGPRDILSCCELCCYSRHAAREAVPDGRLVWATGSGAPRMPARELAPVLDEVDEDIVAESVGRSEKGPAPVELSDLLNEGA